MSGETEVNVASVTVSAYRTVGLWSLDSSGTVVTCIDCDGVWNPKEELHDKSRATAATVSFMFNEEYNRPRLDGDAMCVGMGNEVSRGALLSLRHCR